MKQERIEKRFPLPGKQWRVIAGYISLFVIVFLTSSCGALSPLRMDSYMKKVELGMMKKEVRSIAGDSYKVVEMSRNERFDVEVWEYIAENGTYRLHFINDKLDYMEYGEYVEPHHGKHPPKHRVE